MRKYSPIIGGRNKHGEATFFTRTIKSPIQDRCLICKSIDKSKRMGNLFYCKRIHHYVRTEPFCEQYEPVDKPESVS